MEQHSFHIGLRCYVLLAMFASKPLQYPMQPHARAFTIQRQVRDKLRRRETSFWKVAAHLPKRIKSSQTYEENNASLSSREDEIASLARNSHS